MVIGRNYCIIIEAAAIQRDYETLNAHNEIEIAIETEINGKGRSDMDASSN